jgi:long-subunit acyl-CoA synthetase (AMP-forming)
VPRLYETVHQGVMQKFAAGSVVQRAVVAVVMWVSRAYMHARRCATNRLFYTPLLYTPRLHASFTRLVYAALLVGLFCACMRARGSA